MAPAARRKETGKVMPFASTRTEQDVEPVDLFTLPSKSWLQIDTSSFYRLGGSGLVGYTAPFLSVMPMSSATPAVIEAIRTVQVRVDALEEKVAQVASLQLSGFATLNTLSRPEMRLRSPIAITIDFDEDGFVVARWIEALLEGEGRTQLDAIQDLREQIVDAYEDLRDAQATGNALVDQAAALWGLLNEFVSTRATP